MSDLRMSAGGERATTPPPPIADAWSTYRTGATTYPDDLTRDCLTAALERTTEAPDYVRIAVEKSARGPRNEEVGALELRVAEVDDLLALLAHVVTLARQDGVLPAPATPPTGGTA